MSYDYFSEDNSLSFSEMQQVVLTCLDEKKLDCEQDELLSEDEKQSYIGDVKEAYRFLRGLSEDVATKADFSLFGLVNDTYERMSKNPNQSATIQRQLRAIGFVRDMVMEQNRKYDHAESLDIEGTDSVLAEIHAFFDKQEDILVVTADGVLVDLDNNPVHNAEFTRLKAAYDVAHISTRELLIADHNRRLASIQERNKPVNEKVTRYSRTPTSIQIPTGYAYSGGAHGVLVKIHATSDSPSKRT